GTQPNGTEEMVALVASYLKPAHRVLDLGCGLGRRETDFRAQCRLVIGCDYVDSVRDNRFISAGVRGDAYRLPFSDHAFDVVVMDFVLEHLETPPKCAAEISRVLRPGGALFFRTPNFYHYVAIIAFVTPHWFHRRVIRELDDSSPTPFKTYYRINTRADVKRVLGNANLRAVEIRMVEKEPHYLTFAVPAFLVGFCYERLVNRFKALAGLRSNIFGHFRKSDEPAN
ncbi:MAG: class I SAM-dependent methyltransferase, partial [Acidobacteriota bacterium]